MGEQIIGLIVVLAVAAILMFFNYRRKTRGLRGRIIKMYSQCQAAFGVLRVQAYNKGYEDRLVGKDANSEVVAQKALQDVLSWLGLEAITAELWSILALEVGKYYRQGYDDAGQCRENWTIGVLGAVATKGQNLFEYLCELSYYFVSGQASREAKEVAARLALEREQLEILGVRLRVEQYKLESLKVKLEALRQEAEAAGA